MATYTTSKITKMSLTTLKSKQSEAEKKLKELRGELISETIIKNELDKIEKSKSEILKINQEISSQRQRREIADGWIGAIFKTQVMPQSAIDTISSLKNKVKNIEEIIHKAESIVRNQEYIKKRIQNGSLWLDKVNSRIKTIENKEEKYNR